MLEAYAFLAMFAVQILVASMLYPNWFMRYWRRQTSNVAAERLAQLYPGVDVEVAQERFFTRYRALHKIIAGLGLLLFVALTGYLQRPDWSDGPVEIVVAVYFMVQMMVPLGLVVWLAIRFDQAHQRSLHEGKRKAVLERRGLFDFISPFGVLLAGLSYLLFVAFVIYLQRHPPLGFAGLINIGGITLVYAVNAFVVYTMLYGKKAHPFQTHADRTRMIGLTVKSCVYSCIVIVAYLSLNFTLILLDWQRWEPFALSVFFVIVLLLSAMGMTAAPREPAASDPQAAH